MNMPAIGHVGRQILDRDFQLRLLTQLANYYPHSHVGRSAELEEDEAKLKVNLFYLRDHGLLETNATVGAHFRGNFSYGYSKITNKGLDFLAEDGGLTAILGVQTIKFHEDTIREIILGKINQSDLTQPDKRRMTDALRELPADSIKHLTTKLLDVGLDKSQDAIHWLTKYLFQ